MSEAKPEAAVSKRQLRWYQFSLRTLLLGVTAAAVMASLISTMYWWRTHHPSQWESWGNDFSDRSESVPHFFVIAYAINGQMPTVACFARIDDPKRVKAGDNPMPWLKCEGEGQVFIEGRRISHQADKLQLFVDDGSGHPTLIILDPADVKRYFDRDNFYFKTYRSFVDFWENVLQRKYLRRSNNNATPPANPMGTVKPRLCNLICEAVASVGNA